MAFKKKCAAAIVSLLFPSLAPKAYAGETPAAFVGGAFESASTTVAPFLGLQAPVGEASTLFVSQIGWTSEVRLEIPCSQACSFVSSVAVTPVRAHFSHDIYDADDRRLSAEEFDDTALRLTMGAAFRLPPFRLYVGAVLGKEWISGLPGDLADNFATPFAGGEASLTFELLRSSEPLHPRIDGARLVLRGEGLYAAHPWMDADVSASLGRKVGPFFGRLEAGAFYVSQDNPVTQVVVGGSWDLLRWMALYGHPLGAFRLARGAAGTAGVDVKIAGPIEMGVRGSVLLGAPAVHGGVAALLLGDVAGVYFFAGAGWPDRTLFRGDLSRTSIFVGLSSALLFLP